MSSRWSRAIGFQKALTIGACERTMRSGAVPWLTTVGNSLIDGKILVKAGFAAFFDRITIANSLFFQSSCRQIP